MDRVLNDVTWLRLPNVSGVGNSGTKEGKWEKKAKEEKEEREGGRIFKTERNEKRYVGESMWCQTRRNREIEERRKTTKTRVSVSILRRPLSGQYSGPSQEYPFRKCQEWRIYLKTRKFVGDENLESLRNSFWGASSTSLYGRVVKIGYTPNMVVTDKEIFCDWAE